MNELRLLAETTGASESPTGFFGILLSGGLVGILILLVLAALSITAAYLLFDQIRHYAAGSSSRGRQRYSASGIADRTTG